MSYNFCLFIFLFILFPKILWERLRGKRHPAFLQRLGFFLPQMNNVIWVHAVSVGEVKAAVPFFLLLKEKFPQHQFCFTATTQTGFEEAKKIAADAHFYLPLDFSFAANRFVRKIDPRFLFLVEGDLWPNLLRAVKKNRGKTFLISGKMSERSFYYYSLFPKFTHNIFKELDLVCAQTDEHATRFMKFTNQVKITGNLKYDMVPLAVELKSREFLTIANTHPGEEELLLEATKILKMPIFLAPRHPERFSEVAKLLKRKNISFARLSEKKDSNVILVDIMGQLPLCYSQSKIAFIGGSFIPGIGGHNFLEPMLYGCPCIFGPYTHKQKEIVAKILQSNAGQQVLLENLLHAAEQMLKDFSSFTTRSQHLIQDLRGAVTSTWNEILIRK